MRTYTFTETESSNVRRVGYDCDTKVMSVVFKDLKFRYDYQAVQPDVAAAIIFADSVGERINALLVRSGAVFVKVDLHA